MRIGAALSTLPDAPEAAREALGRALEALEGEQPDLVVAFHSIHHLARIAEVAGMLATGAKPAAVIGCTAQAVVGDGREVEAGPAFSVWAARLDGARVEPFVLGEAQTDDGPTILGIPPVADDTRAIILLGEPYTFPTDALEQLNALRAGDAPIPVIGGMASGGRGRGHHALVYNGDVRTAGAVGVTLSGDIRIETLVSQGCKPIGATSVVTAADGNVIQGLAGSLPMEKLGDLFRSLAPDDQERARHGLHVGVVIDEYASEFGPGDFLIRNVIGADQRSGWIAIGEPVSVGQTVQFHIRDASAADEDLNGSLGVLELSRVGDPSTIAGALLFTCNGRGMNLFGAPDHDVAAVRSHLGPLPVAGMFCAGEIGPVGGKNFLHGFTASVALFVNE
ncbi:MAG TPA: FIST N-terminal domain-containing protein [Actinomycetota bacterium]|nr:FIST N-terminal domain-containing protein [Actinomycetota bacterium]